MKTMLKKNITREEVLCLAKEIVTLSKDRSSNYCYLGLGEEWLNMVEKNIANDWLDTVSDITKELKEYKDVWVLMYLHFIWKEEIK